MRLRFSSFVILTSYFSAALAAAAPPAVPIAAPPLPLSAVRLTGGPLKRAQDLDAAYLLSLDPDRMLHHLRLQAGLQPRSKEGYGGWDGGGRQLTGHIAGHYLSAVSLMFEATGDERFRERARYLVGELKEIQDANGDGYIGGLQGEVKRDGKKVLVSGRERFADLSKGVIESGGFDLNGMWSPWYVQHKLYAGLRDAHRHARIPGALEVEVRFAEWAERLLKPLSEEQIQKMLGTEFGAMNEIFADLYLDTGDRRWLAAYHFFEHRALVDPLAEGRDVLPGKHGNTQVPKLLGDLQYHIATGAEKQGRAARFFWDTVVRDHTYATGGHGKDEYFGPPAKLSERVDGRTAETCNVYNMLKYTRTLFSLDPQPRYAAFLERGLYNHILSSIDSEDGRTCYMVPVGRGVTREYQDMQNGFTCCVGSGMESHALHALGVYHASDEHLWVNVLAPSVARWEAQGLTLTQDTDFPEGETATFSFALREPRSCTVTLLRPAWCVEGFALTLNGRTLDLDALPGTQVTITRVWRDGDRLVLRAPKSLRLEPVPDNPARVAVLWGPLVLASDLGPEPANDGPRPEPVVLVTDGAALSAWLKPVDGKPGHFRTAGVGRPVDVEFAPFAELHRRTYAVYQDLFTTAEWTARAAELERERAERKRLEAATVAFVQPGEMQPERDFQQQGEESEPVRVMGRAGRKARKWFSFEVPVDRSASLVLVVTYNADEWRTRTFNILVNGRVLAEHTIEKGQAPRFYDVRYAIPADALPADRTTATIRFEATRNNETGAVYGVRVIRAE